VAAELNTLGVPLIVPVFVSKDNPATDVVISGVMLNDSVPNPPVAVTGTKLAAVTFCVSVVVATAVVATIAGGVVITKVNDLLLV